MPDIEITRLPDIEPNVKPEKHIFFTALKDKAVEYRLQQLLNINPKVWNDMKDAGVIPSSGTYEEFITLLFSHYRSKKESAVTKTKDSAKEMRSNDDEYANLMKQEKISVVRLNRAKERSFHIANMEKRGKLVNKDEEFVMIELLIRSIATVLRTAADTDPALQKTVDECFKTLFRFGETLAEQVVEDKEQYIEVLMNRPLHLQSIINSTALDEDAEDTEDEAA